MADANSQPSVTINHDDFNPNLHYDPQFRYPTVPHQEHLSSTQNLYPYSNHAGEGAMDSTSTGENQARGHQTLGNVLSKGNQDLSTPSAEELDIPIQSIEQPTNNGLTANDLPAAAAAHSYEETARMDPEGRAGSKHSQVLQSVTPEPLFNKIDRKKRRSSSAASPAANKRRKTPEERKSKGQQRAPLNRSDSNTNIPSSPMETIARGVINPRVNPKENKNKLAPKGSPKLNTPTPDSTKEKRKFDVASPSTNKRRRKSDDNTPEQQVPNGLGSENVNTSLVFISQEQQLGGHHDQIAMSAKAREVGVHSTVALFRPATEASKKYSRPPMSELYEKLQVTPDQFLHLQAAAKDYMLDPDHPERREIIGKKSSIDLPSSKSAKIKLYQITSAFLWEEGWGEKCWGPTAPRSVPRDIDWPEAEPEVVGMMIPLMRRMVTNENQRLYAEEQRKARAPYTSGGGKREPNPEEILEKLKGQIYKPKKSKSPKGVSGSENSLSPDPAVGKSENRAGGASPKPKLKPPTEWDGMHFYINITKDGRRAMPRVEFAVDNGEGFTHLSQHVDIIIDDEKTHKVRVLGPTGLVDITDEASWKRILTAIKGADWMDGDVRICADLDS